MAMSTTMAKVDAAFVKMPVENTTTSETLMPGAYTQFGFTLDQISAMNLRPDGVLEMKLDNGSTLLIQNFKDLANSAESCGRDTLFQFMQTQLQAGGGTAYQIVNISPDALLKSLDPAAAADPTIVLNAPAAHITKEILMEPGQTYKINFPWSDAAKTIDGTNLMLSFKNGGLMILRDFVPAMQNNLPPVMTLADGTVIDPSTLVVAACAPVQTPEPVALVKPDSVLRAPDIEPAAGPAKHAAPKKMAAQDVAQNLADIEPAAGTANATSGGRGGAGFASGIDAANLNGLSPIGALGPTALTYGIPSVGDNPARATIAAGPIVPPPPVDGRPTIGNDVQSIDETGLGPLTVNGTYAFNYGTDGAGAIAANGLFNAAGSIETGTLRHNGIPVVVSQVGNVYTGVAGGVTVFELVVNADGTYVFRQFANLDHANPNDPNDIITLNFGIGITDADGDAAAGTITINIADDGPVANNDAAAVQAGQAIVGDVIPNDDAGQDIVGRLTQITINGVTTPIAAAGDTTVIGAFGTLVINATGAYTYTASPGIQGTDAFVYTLVDREGDPATATFSIVTTLAPVEVPDAPQLNVAPVICIPEDVAGGRQLLVDARLVDRDGSETLTVSIAGIPNTWTFIDLRGGVYDAATQTWTITLPAGTLDFNGGPIVQAPTASDVDANLTAMAMATETSNGTSATTSSAFLGRVDAVADTPSLTVTGTANGAQNSAIALNINGNLNDNDGSETLSIRIAGLPAGATLSAGVLQPDGSYLLTPAQLVGLTVTPANGYSGTFNLSVTAIATETPTDAECDLNNNTAQTVDTIAVNVAGPTDNADAPQITLNTICIPEDSNGTQLRVQAHLVDRDGSETLTIVMGNIPAGWTMVDAQGGVYDAAARTWTITLPAGTYDFDGGPIMRPPANSDVDGANISVRAIATEVSNGSTAETSGTFLGRVDAIADGVSLSVSASGNQDVGATFPVDVSAVLGDNDGSEVLFVYVSDMPLGTTLSAGVQQGDGSYILRAADLPGLNVTLPPAYVGSFTMRVVAQAQEQVTDADCRLDNNVSSVQASVTISVTGNPPADDTPVIGDDTKIVDETALGPLVVNGNVVHTFGNDGPGNIAATGAFTPGGSMAAGTLSHNGVPVVVSLTGNTYTGVAGGVTVFTLVVNNDATYTFQQFANLDHADANDPNDIINLNFGVRITDSDGDADTGTITIAVRDDGPLAVNDNAAVQAGNAQVGNVMINDSAGQDGQGVVTSVTINGVTTAVAGATNIVGTFGTLNINSAGVYTYTANPGVNGVDTFTYTIRDREGDTSSANFSVNVTAAPPPPDDVPVINDNSHVIDETNLLVTQPIVVNGSVTYDYGDDGPGEVNLCDVSTISVTGATGGILSHFGVPVTWTLDSATNTYTGMAGSLLVCTFQINNDGTYTYKQFCSFDHNDPNNPDELINLNFCTEILDRDGDRDTGTVTISVKDDAPVTVNDANAAFVGNTAFWNVVWNDGSAEWGHTAQVDRIVVNGVDYDLSAGMQLIDTGTAILQMWNDGRYNYTVYNGNVDHDVIQYRMVDGDGDAAWGRLDLYANQNVPLNATNMIAANVIEMPTEVSAAIDSFIADTTVEPRIGAPEPLPAERIGGFEVWGGPEPLVLDDGSRQAA